MASASINDTLPAGAPRRFPFVYAPPQSPGIASLIQTRTSPSGFAFDLGLFVNGALLNHGFRALAEGGLLDQALTVAGGQVQLRALAAPQYLPGAGTGGKPLNILIPNLLITNSAGTRVTADLALGVDATVDPGTGQLVPTADVGFKFTVLGCEGGPVLCDLTNSAVVAALQDAILQYVVNPLLANSIGQIALPSVLGLVVSGAKVESIGGTLAVMVNAAPSPRATATAAFSGGNPHTAPTSFSTTVNPAFFPGSGAYSVHWVIIDGVDGSVVVNVTNNSTTMNLDAEDFTTDTWEPCIRLKSADVQVTVTRGGYSATATASAERDWFVNSNLPC